ncbi:hypothetical protein GG344DRAFT_66860 [Lentinula edodes]|nr:hypothetical protein GG344DRAFT_66860 [Lentinula edodes]
MFLNGKFDLPYVVVSTPVYEFARILMETWSSYVFWFLFQMITTASLNSLNLQSKRRQTFDKEEDRAQTSKIGTKDHHSRKKFCVGLVKSSVPVVTSHQVVKVPESRTKDAQMLMHANQGQA